MDISDGRETAIAYHGRASTRLIREAPLSLPQITMHLRAHTPTSPSPTTHPSHA